MCGFATAQVAAALTGRSPEASDLLGPARRPLAAPVTLSDIAALNDEP
ncbi:MULTISPECIES: hypothetical protein [unclassified Streptomyces]